MKKKTTKVLLKNAIISLVNGVVIGMVPLLILAVMLILSAMPFIVAGVILKAMGLF